MVVFAAALDVVVRDTFLVICRGRALDCQLVNILPFKRMVSHGTK